MKHRSQGTWDSRGNQQTGYCRGVPQIETREYKRGPARAPPKAGGTGSIKGSLHFCLQSVWGGDGHSCTLPQSSQWCYSLYSGTRHAHQAKCLQDVGTESKTNHGDEAGEESWGQHSLRNPQKPPPKGRENEGSPFTPPAVTQQGHAHSLTKTLPGSRLPLWSETAVPKGEYTMLCCTSSHGLQARQ